MAPPSWDQSRGLWRHWAGIAMTVVQADRFSMDVRYFRTCLCQLITESAAALCIRADLPGITCTGKRHLDFMSHNLMLFASICSTYILSYYHIFHYIWLHFHMSSIQFSFTSSLWFICVWSNRLGATGISPMRFPASRKSSRRPWLLEGTLSHMFDVVFVGSASVVRCY